MALAPALATQLGTVGVLIGLGLGAVEDWRSREVTDRLWLLMAIGGGVLGAAVFVGDSGPALLAWLLVTALAVGQLVPWEGYAARVHERLPDAIDLGLFLAVGGSLGAIGIARGFGGTGAPIEAIAAFVGTVLARGLYELRLLYGGADAKALIAVSLLIPLDPSPWIGLPSTAVAILSLYPFSLTVLMNAALLAVIVPIALLAHNLRRGEFRGWSSFVTYSVPVGRLPDGFVWLREPELPGMKDDADEVETTSEDRELRSRQRERLEALGVERVWVSPQLPFLVALFAGAVSALALGNLVFDLLAIL